MPENPQVTKEKDLIASMFEGVELDEVANKRLRNMLKPLSEAYFEMEEEPEE